MISRFWIRHLIEILTAAGGRDSVCRVWDMRTKVQVHCMAGHDDTVASILANPTSPEVRRSQNLQG